MVGLRDFDWPVYLGLGEFLKGVRMSTDEGSWCASRLLAKAETEPRYQKATFYIQHCHRLALANHTFKSYICS